MTSYAQGSLYYLPYVDKSVTVGLREGSLYESLAPNVGIGTISLNATGFNITCGYWDDVSVVFSDEKYQATRNIDGTVTTTEILSTRK